MLSLRMAKVCAVLVCSLWVASAQAAGTSVPYTFSSGAPARASEVNANFQALATAVDTTNATLTGVLGASTTGSFVESTPGGLSSRSVSYTKVSSSSGLKITYTDTFHINVAAGGNGAKWYIAIDGTATDLNTFLVSQTATELIVPGAISGVVSGINVGAHTIKVYMQVVGAVSAVTTGYGSGSYFLEVQEIP